MSYLVSGHGMIKKGKIVTSKRKGNNKKQMIKYSMVLLRNNVIQKEKKL